MRRKWVTEIEVERQETLVIRQPRSAARPSCPACGGMGTMIPPEEAAAVAAANLRAVFRWIEASLVHFTETPDGKLYVCLNSLPPGAGTQPLTKDVITDDRQPPIDSLER